MAVAGTPIGAPGSGAEAAATAVGSIVEFGIGEVELRSCAEEGAVGEL